MFDARGTAGQKIHVQLNGMGRPRLLPRGLPGRLMEGCQDPPSVIHIRWCRPLQCSQSRFGLATRQHDEREAIPKC